MHTLEKWKYSMGVNFKAAEWSGSKGLLPLGAEGGGRPRGMFPQNTEKF